jgi:hypothetical protein
MERAAPGATFIEAPLLPATLRISRGRGAGIFGGSAVFMRPAYDPLSIAIMGVGILLVTALAFVF